MSNAKKQHPLVIFIGALEEIRRFIVPLVIILGISVFSGDSPSFSPIYFWIPFVFIIGSLVLGFLRWLFYRYEYYDDTLYINKGIVIKSKRSIQKHRVQTINIEAGVLLRVFKLVSVRIETAGGLGESELELKALSKTEAVDLKARFDDDFKDAVPAEDKGEAVTAKRLLLAGVTSGSVGVVIGISIAFLSQLVFFLPERLFNQIFNTLLGSGIYVLALIIMLYLFGAWGVAIIRYVVRYAFFNITKTNGELEIKRGLIKQKQLSLKTHRIQAVSMVEGIFRQPIKTQTIVVDVAGGSAYKEQSKTVLHPLIKTADMPRYFEYVLKDYKITKVYDRVPLRALRRYLFRISVWFIPVFLIGLQWRLAWVGFVLYPFAVLLAAMAYKDAGIYLFKDQIICRSRRLARTTTLIKKKNVQAFEIKRSIFQRMRKLASVKVWVLSSPSSQTYTVKDLSLEDVLKVYNWLS